MAIFEQPVQNHFLSNCKREKTMKVIFHKRFYEVYAHDPAAAAGQDGGDRQVPSRMNSSLWNLSRHRTGTSKGSTDGSMSDRSRTTPSVYEVGRLAAGGAILAA